MLNNKMIIKTFTLKDFYQYRINKHSFLYLLMLTSSFYPRFLSRGYYSKTDNEIIIAKTGNWKLRIKHECGHAKGLKHTWKYGYIMHPWFLFRGTKYL